MPYDFKQKTACVTGAARGIGRAVAEKLAAGGARLVLCDIDEKGVTSLRDRLLSRGTEAIALSFDISDEAAVCAAFNTAKAHFGQIDILINNAGIYTVDMGPFCESRSAAWKKKTEINIYGTMYMTRAVLPDMMQRRYGRIVNIASVAGVYGITNMVDYSMTKAAIIGFTRALAKEAAPYHVTVNALSPGNIDVAGSPLPDYSFLGRSGTPEECANGILFLASDESSFVSGQNYIVDGCRKKM